MRKLIVCLLLLTMLASMLPVQAMAESYENTYVNTGNQRNDIVGVALTQVGYQEGKGTGVWNNDTKYGDTFGNPNTEWCGWFVSWCARQANVPTSVLKTSGRAVPANFGLSNYYTSSEYTPRPGDLFFKKNFGHVGLVYYVDGDYFYTLEGNTSTSGWEGHSVMCRRRALSEFYFASPNYTSDSGSTTPAPSVHTHNYTELGNDSSHPHKEYKKCACGEKSYTGNEKEVADCSSCKQVDCTHTYGSWTNAGSNHQKSCTNCGKKETASHDWQEFEVTKEATCKEDGTMSQTCGTCGATQTTTIKKLDSHEYGDWIAVDETTHKRICQYCEVEQTGEHYLMQNKDGTPILQSDSENHWYQCADCLRQTQVEPHTVVTDQDDKVHWQACKSCERVLIRKAHNFDNECDTDCSDCSITRQTTHQYGESLSHDGKEHWYCCEVCGNTKDLAPHNFQVVTDESGKYVEMCVDCSQLSGRVVAEPTVPTEEDQNGKKIDELYIFVGAGVLFLLVIVVLISIAVRKSKNRKKV